MWKILIITLFCFNASFAQENNLYSELIVQVPKLTEWKAFKISRQLNCLEGLRYLGYFKERSCLLFHVDAKKIADINIITTTIHHLNEKMKTDEIKGYSIYDVLDNKLPETTIKKK